MNPSTSSLPTVLTSPPSIFLTHNHLYHLSIILLFPPIWTPPYCSCVLSHNAHPLSLRFQIPIPPDGDLSCGDDTPYLGGDGASKQNGVAEVEGRGVGEDTQPVPAMGRHAEGAVPLVQGEEERGKMQRDENPHPHGPVEGPHEGSDGGCGVFAADLEGREAEFIVENGIF